MIHVVLHAAPGTLLFRTWEEARALWDRLVARVPFRALTLMPDHVHLELADGAGLDAVGTAMRAYALWRNRHRGSRGAVWGETPQPTPIRGRDHVVRTRGYIALNPCRKGLVRDPLAWPFSTHRDAVGLALPAVCRRASDPARYHAYVSADPSVGPSGSRLPEPNPEVAALRSAGVAEVLIAVSALTRTPAAMLRDHGPERTLFMCAARALSTATSAEIAVAIGVEPSTVRHVEPLGGPELAIIARVLGDPRFPLLADGDLRRTRAWSAYHGLR